MVASDVAITVESTFSMNRAVARTRGMAVEARPTAGSVVLTG
jgi:hypothetical protein